MGFDNKRLIKKETSLPLYFSSRDFSKNMCFDKLFDSVPRNLPKIDRKQKQAWKTVQPLFGGPLAMGASVLKIQPLTTLTASIFICSQ